MAVASLIYIIPPFKVGGVRQVNKVGRRSESDKTEKPAKATAEDIEEFGEDKKEKPSTAIVSGAKTGNCKELNPSSQLSLAL